MLTYKKQSLFDAPKGSMLLHACNAQGVWGSGIAKEMKERFPLAFKHYNAQCLEYEMVGDLDLTSDNDHIIASIITSNNYAQKVDTPEEILVNTTLALNSLCKMLIAGSEYTIYSNKFNSGLFKVPWNRTEEIIKVFVKRYNITWIVCDPSLE